MPKSTIRYCHRWIYVHKLTFAISEYCAPYTLRLLHGNGIFIDYEEPNKTSVKRCRWQCIQRMFTEIVDQMQISVWKMWALDIRIYIIRRLWAIVTHPQGYFVCETDVFLANRVNIKLRTDWLLGKAKQNDVGVNWKRRVNAHENPIQNRHTRMEMNE